MSLLLNSETNTNRFPRARPFLAGQERPGQLRLPHPASSAASLPAAPVVTPGREPLWAAVGVSVPPAHQKHTPEVSFHGSGSGPGGRWERSAFPFGNPSPAFASQRARIPVLPPGRFGSYFVSPFPIQSPQTENGPQDWRVMVVGVTCFLRFFFFFLFFLNKSSFLYNDELRGPCETPLPHGRLVYFRGVGQVVPIARPAVDRQRREGRAGPKDLSRHRM